MRALYATLVVPLLCTCSTPPPNAGELLREMQAALIASDAFRYEFELSSLNPGDEPRRTLHGTAAISRLDLSGGLYLARMQATDVSSEEARPFIATKTEDEVCSTWVARLRVSLPNVTSPLCGPLNRRRGKVSALR